MLHLNNCQHQTVQRQMAIWLMGVELLDVYDGYLKTIGRIWFYGYRGWTVFSIAWSKSLTRFLATYHQECVLRKVLAYKIYNTHMVDITIESEAELHHKPNNINYRTIRFVTYWISSRIAFTAFNILAQKPVTRADERWTEFDRPLMTPRKRGSPSLIRLHARADQ